MDGDKPMDRAFLAGRYSDAGGVSFVCYSGQHLSAGGQTLSVVNGPDGHELILNGVPATEEQVAKAGFRRTFHGASFSAGDDSIRLSDV